MITSPYFGICHEAAEEERRLQGNSGRLRNVAYVVNDGDDVNKTDVFILLAEGMPVKDICELLGCSEFTIQEMLDEVVSMGTLFKNRQHLENFRVLYQQAGSCRYYAIALYILSALEHLQEDVSRCVSFGHVDMPALIEVSRGWDSEARSLLHVVQYFITSEGLVNARVGDIFSYLSKANFFVVVNALKMFHFDGYDELLKSAGF